MPMLVVWKCPVCGVQSEPGNGQPAGWITVATQTSTPEVFDTWQCAAAYTQQQLAPES